MDDSALAARLGDLVGGPGNVRAVDICATRLRFLVRDRAKVRTEDLAGSDGVTQVLQSAGQTQVVIGANVEDVLRALVHQPGWAHLRPGPSHGLGAGDDAAAQVEDAGPRAGSRPGHPGRAPAAGASGDDRGAGPPTGAGADPTATADPRSLLDRLFALLAGTFQPLITPLVGASMIAMLLRVTAELGWYSATDPPPGVVLLTAASNAAFHFLPVFVAITAARQLDANPFVAGAIMAALLDPNFLSLGETGKVTDAFGVPLYVFAYSSSVVPALLVAVALAVLEPRLRRWTPPNLRLVVVPTVSLAVLVPLTAVLFGPFGVLVGRALADALTWLDGVSPVLLSVTVAGSFLFFVTFGVHWALVPLVLVNLDELGSDPITAAMGAYNFAVWGLAVGVFLRAGGNRRLRGVAGAGTLSGLLGGISEPMLYGVILRYRRVIPIVVGSAVAGGAVVGLLGVRSTALAFSSVFTIPLMEPTAGYLVGIATSFGLALVGVLAFGYQSATDSLPAAGPSPAGPAPGVGDAVAGTAAPDPTGTTATRAAAAPVPTRSAARSSVLASPMAGTVLPLADVPDPMFAAGLVGPGVAITPSEGLVVSPATGTVVMAPPSGHAVGVRSEDGVEVIVHVGVGTVRLRGDGFRCRVVPGQPVDAGDVLVEVDLDRLAGLGVELASPVVVTNAAAFGPVTPVAAGAVRRGDPLLTVAGRDDGSPS